MNIPLPSISVMHFVTIMGMFLCVDSRCLCKSTPNVDNLRFSNYRMEEGRMGRGREVSGEDGSVRREESEEGMEV